jgi:hypothetical protein
MLRLLLQVVDPHVQEQAMELLLHVLQNEFLDDWDVMEETPQNLTAEAVAVLPPPGLSGPSALVFSPNNNKELMMNNNGSNSNNNNSYLVLISTSTKITTSRRLRGVDMNTATNTTTATTNERQLCSLDLRTLTMSPLLRLLSKRRFEVETGVSGGGIVGPSSVMTMNGCALTRNAKSARRPRREGRKVSSSASNSNKSWRRYNKTIQPLRKPRKSWRFGTRH